MKQAYNEVHKMEKVHGLVVYTVAMHGFVKYVYNIIMVIAIAIISYSYTLHRASTFSTLWS